MSLTTQQQTAVNNCVAQLKTVEAESYLVGQGYTLDYAEGE